MTWFCGSSKTVGQSHIASGIPCQDAVAYRVVSSTKFVTALSDGAGSAAKSQIGSQTLVETVCNHVGNLLLETSQTNHEYLDRAVKESILLARDQLRKLGNPEEFHATALIAVGLDKEVVVYHIGDGSITIGENLRGGFVIHRSEPENGEFANETFFYTQEVWEQHFRKTTIKNSLFVILASDGVDPFIWDSKGTRTGFIKPLLQKIQSLNLNNDADKFLNEIITDPRTNEVTNDDKSIIIAVHNELINVDINNKKFEDAKPPTFKSQENLDQELKAALSKNIQKDLTDQKNQQTQPQITVKKNNGLIKYFYMLLAGTLITIPLIFISTSNSPFISSIKKNIYGPIYVLFGISVPSKEEKKLNDGEPLSATGEDNLQDINKPANENISSNRGSSSVNINNLYEDIRESVSNSPVVNSEKKLNEKKDTSSKEKSTIRIDSTDKNIKKTDGAIKNRDQ